MVQVSISPGGVPNRAIEAGQVTSKGIAGDGWRHLAFHGTSKRAILLMTSEGIDELVARGFPVFYGALGENITTQRLDRRSLRIGQRFQAGEAVIELTEVRVPCDTLRVYGAGLRAVIFDARAQAWDPTSERWGMSGFYASVTQPGIVRPGDPIALVP